MKLICFVVILYAFITDVSAQDSIVNNRRYNVDIGVGTHDLVDNKYSGGITFLFGADIFKNDIFLRLGAKINEEITLFGPNPAENYNSFDIQVGKEWLLGTRDEFGINDFGFKVSSGMGITTGQIRGVFLYSSGGFFGSSTYSSRSFVVPSIPINIELIFKPSKVAGIGIMFFADLNNIRPYYGFAGKLSMGRLK